MRKRFEIISYLNLGHLYQVQGCAMRTPVYTIYAKIKPELPVNPCPVLAFLHAYSIRFPDLLHVHDAPFNSNEPT